MKYTSPFNKNRFTLTLKLTSPLLPHAHIKTHKQTHTHTHMQTPNISYGKIWQKVTQILKNIEKQNHLIGQLMFGWHQ